MTKPTYPGIEVQLTGTDGNAFALIGKVKRAIKNAEGREAAAAFTAEAFEQKSYDELLGLLMNTVKVS